MNLLFKEIFTKTAAFVVISLAALLGGTNFLQYIKYLQETGPVPITFYVYLNSFFWLPFEFLYQGSTDMILYEGSIEKVAVPLFATFIYWLILLYVMIFTIQKGKALLNLDKKRDDK